MMNSRGYRERQPRFQLLATRVLTCGSRRSHCSAWNRPLCSATGLAHASEIIVRSLFTLGVANKSLRRTARTAQGVLFRARPAVFYQPVQSKRFFSRGIKYSDIDWTDFRRIVAAFKERIEDWYIRPAEEPRRASWDFSFALMVIDCLLIDTLSQFHYGQNSSSRGTFKKYIRRRLPDFRAKLPTPIQKRPERRKRRKARTTPLAPLNPRYYKTFADILYHCFRCGILHDAHITLCGGLAGLGGKLVDIDPDVCTKYRDGSDCPTVRMDPTVIFDEVKKLFNDYIATLLDPDSKNDVRRSKFKKKFKYSIGIDITQAS